MYGVSEAELYCLVLCIRDIAGQSVRAASRRGVRAAGVCTVRTRQILLFDIPRRMLGAWSISIARVHRKARSRYTARTRVCLRIHLEERNLARAQLVDFLPLLRHRINDAALLSPLSILFFRYRIFFLSTRARNNNCRVSFFLNLRPLSSPYVIVSRYAQFSRRSRAGDSFTSL